MSVAPRLLWALCVLPVIAGCGGPSTRVASNATDASGPVGAAKLGTLEVSWWAMPPVAASLGGLGSAAAAVNTDPAPHLEVVLGKYERNDTGLPAEQLLAWRANGLRVIAVPTNELESIRASLHASGPVEHQLLAQSGMWKPAYKGPGWTGQATLQLDNGPLSLPAGALRAMVRSWLVPIPAIAESPEDQTAEAAARVAGSPRAGMQFEFALQHVETRRPVSEFQAALAIDTRKTLNDEGLVFWRLALNGTLMAGWSYLIVPVDPGAEWKVGALDRLAEQGAAKITEGVSSSSTNIAGPALPTPPTLGASLLSNVLRGGTDRQFILVLTPNVPERFELMPMDGMR